jgi:hypothetical protein
MAKLPKYWLSRDKRYFDTKADATAGDVLKRALGEDGGSMRIEKLRGGYQCDIHPATQSFDRAGCA